PPGRGLPGHAGHQRPRAHRPHPDAPVPHRGEVAVFRTLALLLFVPVLAWAQGPPAVTVERDVVYGKAGDVELKLDLVRPAKGEGPFPAVVCIHGGAWVAGARNAEDGMAQLLARNGYVAVTISYRLAPKHRFPAQIEDAKCAVRFLRA